MKAHNFPYIVVGFGLIVTLVVVKGNELRISGVSEIPLLTLLVINEVAFFATAIGAYIGFRHMQTVGLKTSYTVITAACVLLAGQFMWFGVDLWPR